MKLFILLCFVAFTLAKQPAGLVVVDHASTPISVHTTEPPGVVLPPPPPVVDSTNGLEHEVLHQFEHELQDRLMDQKLNRVMDQETVIPEPFPMIHDDRVEAEPVDKLPITPPENFMDPIYKGADETPVPNVAIIHGDHAHLVAFPPSPPQVEYQEAEYKPQEQPPQTLPLLPPHLHLHLIPDHGYLKVLPPPPPPPAPEKVFVTPLWKDQHPALPPLPPQPAGITTLVHVLHVEPAPVQYDTPEYKPTPPTLQLQPILVEKKSRSSLAHKFTHRQH